MSGRYEAARVLLVGELRRCGLPKQAEALRLGEIFRVDSYVALQCIARMLPPTPSIAAVDSAKPLIDRPCRDGCNNPACCPTKCCHPLPSDQGIGR
jgi:hypothetical protein